MRLPPHTIGRATPDISAQTRAHAEQLLRIRQQTRLDPRPWRRPPDVPDVPDPTPA